MTTILIIGLSILINVAVGVWLSRYRIAGKQIANPYQADCKHIPQHDWEGMRGWVCGRCGKVLDPTELVLIWERQRHERQQRIERTRARMVAWEGRRNGVEQ